MIKHYSEKKRLPHSGNTPRKETIKFLLDFSKSLKIVRTKSKNLVELHLN